MKNFRFIASAIFVVAALQCFSVANAENDSEYLLSHADDYVFGYYPYGWRGSDADGNIVFAIQTPSYGLLINASKAQIERAGKLKGSTPESAAQQTNSQVLNRLEPLPITFAVEHAGKRYEAVSAAAKPESVVIQRLGKFLAHIEIRDVVLSAPDGTLLSGLDAKIHVFAWPDHARIVFEAHAKDGFANIKLLCQTPSSKKSGALRFVNLLPGEQSQTSTNGAECIQRALASLDPDAQAQLVVGMFPGQIKALDIKPIVRAKGITPYSGELEVVQDNAFGWHQIVLGANADIRTMERVSVQIENPSDVAQTLHLAFSKRGGGFGITGLSPVLCDENGAPLGLPVQISKNWHCSPPWFDGVTMLELPPGAKRTFEFRLAYADWGGVPAVSHAQLALEGWGTHQLWDECAIGSFGESITYDPDVNLNRSMIDDVRPLLVWGMGQTPQQKWSWTHNVGGGDFLVLEHEGERQYLVRQKTDYDMQGPVLTRVSYSGESPDGAIQSHITTQSWRSDDFVRGLYTLRYDVVKDMAFSRLAFFQLGADRYNTNIFTHLSRGNLDGEVETWAPPMGGKKYSRQGLPLEGEKPWFAITGNTKNPPPFLKEGDQGAWADRGMIVHAWKARLNGDEVTLPHFSIYGTEDGKVPSAIVELSPPSGVTQLKKGDYAEAIVEMVILPQSAHDYYGPNELFRAALMNGGVTWRMVHREAKATALKVRAEHGDVLSQWPVVVRAHRGTQAKFTIEGGDGWIPVTITGADVADKSSINVTADGEPQSFGSSDGNDWRQTRWRSSTKSYDLIYTLALDRGVKESVVDWTADDR